MPSLMVGLKRKSGPLSEDGGDDALMEHKAVAGALKALDALAAEAGVKPITQFVSEDPENVMDLVDDEDEAEEILAKLPPVQWFQPGEALPTIAALISKVSGGGEFPGIKNPTKVAKELRDLETILQTGESKRATFRFYKEF